MNECKRILVVDDEAHIRLVVSKNLTKLGGDYEIETAGSGEEALRKIEKQNFDLVITDLRMPGIDGLALMNRIRLANPRTRLILITAYGSEQVEARARSMNVYQYITKPFVLGDLLDTVRESLSGTTAPEEKDKLELKGKNILIVEDSPTQAERLRSLLEQEDLNVTCAPDGKQGLDMARRLRPDIIVLDFHMPKMNGLEVCEKLKGAPDTADIPIIMFTSHDVPQTIVLSLKLGVVDYIPKDAFADAVLLQTLRQMGMVGT